MTEPVFMYGIKEKVPSGKEPMNQEDLADALNAAVQKINLLEAQIKGLLPDTPAPCPFCGKDNIKVGLADERETNYRAELSHSCCRGVRLLIRGDSPRDVIHLWNRRGGSNAW